jgi:hypothetical protein
MKTTFPVGQGLGLQLSNDDENRPGFPTARLQKGFILIDNGRELAEEGVGFGVPIIMKGFQTVFPGKIRFIATEESTCTKIKADFLLNLVEKIGRPEGAGIESRRLYDFKNILAALIRKLPVLRRPLTSASNLIRRVFGWETLYERSEYSYKISMTYKINPLAGSLEVEMETQDICDSGITQIVVMNEQGARSFDHYKDSSGNFLKGDQIGCWDEVTAYEASFYNISHGIYFTLEQVAGARLYRGRELIGARLAWSGFGYSFSPDSQRIFYRVKIGRTA